MSVSSVHAGHVPALNCLDVDVSPFESGFCHLTGRAHGPRELNTLVARFGWFDLNGKRVREELLFAEELRKAKVPMAVPVTWTRDGKSLLLQSERDVWLYNFDSKKAHIVARNVIVQKVLNWSQNDSLLVRALSLPSLKQNQ